MSANSPFQLYFISWTEVKSMKEDNLFQSQIKWGGHVYILPVRNS